MNILLRSLSTVSLLAGMLETFYVQPIAAESLHNCVLRYQKEYGISPDEAIRQCREYELRQTESSPFLLQTLSVSSTNPNPVKMTVPLTIGHSYIIEVNGTYNYSGGGSVADAGYASNNSWSSLRSDILTSCTNA
jgi:hypothetical protein